MTRELKGLLGAWALVYAGLLCAWLALGCGTIGPEDDGAGLEADPDDQTDAGPAPRAPVCGDGLAEPGELCFGTGVSHAVAAETQKTLAADMDSDGDADLITAHFGPSVLTILTNDGDGRFVGQRQVPAGTGTTGVAAGDWNGDGRTDLAACSTLTDALLIFTTDASLTPVLSDTLDAPGRPTDVVSGDLDGDLDLDLLVTFFGSRQIRAVLNDGSGGFTARPPVTVPGSLPVLSALGDLDGDGDLDAVTADRDSNTMAVFASDGSAGYTFRESLTTPAGPGPIAIGGIDTDSDLDVLVAASGLTVFANRGDGTLDSVGLVAGTPGGDMSLQDLDGDGDADIAVTSFATNEVFVLINDGEGGFTPRVRVPAGVKPNGIAAADLNDDGAIDLAVADFGGTVTVLLQAP